VNKDNVNKLQNFNIEQFQRDLISWFDSEKRDLPWREDSDPYKIWVSEIMLQQTRVDTVIPYFNNFVQQFPTIEALAEAEEDKVLKAWEGLGYYSRVRNLHAAVKEVKENYQSQVPKDPAEISKLKGVGPYTTGAILSIAYGIPEPAVDGNVMRVMSRILTIWDDIAKPKSRKLFESVIRDIISKSDPSSFNQALMELGALICTPTSPSCLLCPVRDHCNGFEEGVQAELPVKSKKKAAKSVNMSAVVLTNPEGKLLIHKRPKKGLLANLWEFPNHESVADFSAKEQLTQYLGEDYGITAKIGDAFTNIQHVFSHLIWNITVFEGKLKLHIEESETIKLVSIDEIKEYAFPVSHQNILKSFLEK
jgi:A/G-specific adenine glycosylase